MSISFTKEEFKEELKRQGMSEKYLQYYADEYFDEFTECECTIEEEAGEWMAETYILDCKFKNLPKLDKGEPCGK